MQRISYLIIPGIIAILVFIGINEFEFVSSPAEPANELAIIDFDAVSEGINSTMYDSNGAIHYTLEADRQTHYNDDHSVFINPVIHLYEDGESHWQLQADSGRIPAPARDPGSLSARSSKIDLIGNVELFSYDAQGNDIELTTDFLIVDTENESVETDQAVHLTTANLNQSAVGMFADLKSDEFVFHRDLRGVYEPTRD